MDVESRPVLAYGDESNYQEVFTYGFLMIPAPRQSALLDALESTKREFGADLSSGIHCRELFAGDRRSKGPWHHLTRDGVFQLIHALAEHTARCGARSWLGVVKRNMVPRELRMQWESSDPAVPVPDRLRKTEQFVIQDPKQLLHLAYFAAVGPMLDCVQHEHIAAWVDRDRSKLDWFGQSRSANALKSIFPINHNNRKFEPVPYGDNRPPLLDVADVLAYSGAHSMAAQLGSDKPRFSSVFSAFNAGIAVCHFGRMDGPLVSVEVNTARVGEYRSYFGEFLSQASGSTAV